ncbi:MAG: hypothetical protein IKJ81_10645 [Bacteroidales bacterium]|nr:hypothetical protein [Bacteroidales bacterium]
MPMFYTPKPRQFHYRPRFYDPEKEEWEKLKTKYRIDNDLPLDDDELRSQSQANDQNVDEDLEYFQRKVKSIERQERQNKQKIGLADMFRKREVPQFHYVSRFDSEGNIIDTTATPTKENAVKRRITRRFEDDDDFDRFKPVPAGKIMIYTLIVTFLLIFIFF